MKGHVKKSVDCLIYELYPSFGVVNWTWFHIILLPHVIYNESEVT